MSHAASSKARARSREDGFTSVELVIGLALALIVLGGGVVVQIQSAESYRSSLCESQLTGSLRSTLHDVARTALGAASASLAVVAGEGTAADTLRFQTAVGFDAVQGTPILGAEGQQDRSLEFAVVGDRLVRRVLDAAGQVISTTDVFGWLDTAAGAKPFEVAVNGSSISLTLRGRRSIGSRTLSRTLTTTVNAGL